MHEKVFKIDKDEAELAAESTAVLLANPYAKHGAAELKALFKVESATAGTGLARRANEEGARGSGSTRRGGAPRAFSSVPGRQPCQQRSAAQGGGSW